MDYSLLLHVVAFPSANSEGSSALLGSFKSGRPLGAECRQALGIGGSRVEPCQEASCFTSDQLRKDGSQQMYAVSFGIIDLLMHEEDAWLY